jgi:hypothetical protein
MTIKFTQPARPLKAAVPLYQADNDWPSFLFQALLAARNILNGFYIVHLN